MTIALKAAAEALDYQVEWALRGLGTDTIIASTWAIVGKDALLTSNTPTIGNPATTTSVWFAGVL